MWSYDKKFESYERIDEYTNILAKIITIFFIWLRRSSVKKSLAERTLSQVQQKKQINVNIITDFIDSLTFNGSASCVK